ncbi:hypothetical protein [Lyngbya confervoides]|uniref:Uncharacterized protein n=1 Tax=Lyngbya confervoides BDU141951 TaxID=1574623 RepID=A0ABD4T026_9CYAN|nr:hypothetical protein [Lyngbya confervoides]MCM1981765.1 hypothetical protein [Lyngbya confervoides BDU141951]
MSRKLIPLALASIALSLSVQPAFGQNIDSIRQIIEGFIGDPTDLVKPTPKPAPSYEPGALTRTMNLARQAAENANGGLNNYRAEQAMYGPAAEAPYKDNGNGTLTYTFLGGRPAQPPSLQSVVTVALDGSLVNIDYNGPIPTAEGD